MPRELSEEHLEKLAKGRAELKQRLAKMTPAELAAYKAEKKAARAARKAGTAPQGDGYRLTPARKVEAVLALGKEDAAFWADISAEVCNAVSAALVNIGHALKGSEAARKQKAIEAKEAELHRIQDELKALKGK